MQGHKLIREFSTRLSRKSDSLLGLSDVAMRLFVYGCPVLNENFRKILVCSLCGEVGHQKNCRKNKEEDIKNVSTNHESDLQASIDKLVKYLTEIVSVSDE